MAAIEFPEELLKKIGETGPVDLVIGVTGTPDMEALRAKSLHLRDASTDGETALPMKIALAYAKDIGVEPITELGKDIFSAIYPMPVSAGSMVFWTDISAAQRRVLALAAAWKARACMVIHRDLALLDAETIERFAQPVLKGNIDLVMPVYPYGKYEGLINKSLLAPLSRALYGRRVRWPLPADFCAGETVLEWLVEGGSFNTQSEPQILWPSSIVAMQGGQINQAEALVEHAIQSEGIDLNTILTDLAGSLFQQAETYAANWQRVRGSQAVSRYGEVPQLKENGLLVDAGPMVESFLIGLSNLEEVWRLVLPPATMLELKRLARLEVEQFRMPDTLWARIVYDFALAYRMRRVSRTHVLGALTPLYLGWVASHVQEVAVVTAQEAERRVDQLARVFEEQKPYFVSRWRWPERVS